MERRTSSSMQQFWDTSCLPMQSPCRGGRWVAHSEIWGPQLATQKNKNKQMTERLYSTSPLTRNMMEPLSKGESYQQDDFMKSKTTISGLLHSKRQTFIFQKNPTSFWRYRQWHGVWSADSPASLSTAAANTVEHVLINKAINAMKRENKGKKERVRQREQESTEGYN